MPRPLVPGVAVCSYVYVLNAAPSPDDLTAESVGNPALEGASGLAEECDREVGRAPGKKAGKGRNTSMEINGR